MSSNGADQRGPWNTEPAFRYVADPLSHPDKNQHPGIERPDLAEVSKVKVTDREPARSTVSGR